MQIVPLQAVASQVVQVTLGGQLCTIAVYQKFFGLFFDLSIDSVPVIQGVGCLNKVKLVRSAYLGFVGDLCFIDNTGADRDPVYTGLGAAFSLVYLEASDLT
jgi:hypothetical protein